MCLLFWRHFLVLWRAKVNMTLATKCMVVLETKYVTHTRNSTETKTGKNTNEDSDVLFFDRFLLRANFSQQELHSVGQNYLY